jgi:hypothetical protein
MHQARVVAALRQHPRDDLLLADVALGDVLTMVTPAAAASDAAPLRTRSRSVCANAG